MCSLDAAQRNQGLPPHIFHIACTPTKPTIKEKMVNYRRNYIPGGTYFFTITLINRKSKLLIEHIDLLKQSINSVKTKHPFKMKAYVILPEHLHMIWELPQGDSNYSERLKKIKTQFSKSMRKIAYPLPKTKHNEYRLWQRRFWEHTIRDFKDFENHVNYIHYNPVKHGLVHNLKDWPYSSFHYYVKDGRLSENWGSNLLEMKACCFGE